MTFDLCCCSQLNDLGHQWKILGGVNVIEMFKVSVSIELCTCVTVGVEGCGAYIIGRDRAGYVMALDP